VHTPVQKTVTYQPRSHLSFNRSTEANSLIQGHSEYGHDWPGSAYLREISTCRAKLHLPSCPFFLQYHSTACKCYKVNYLKRYVTYLRSRSPRTDNGPIRCNISHIPAVLHLKQYRLILSMKLSEISNSLLISLIITCRRSFHLLFRRRAGHYLQHKAYTD
jgi:hypothetical protein